MNGASQPLVSIVTPVYNGAEHLAECIESILRQTYTNWDYTIVNNYSTDESLAIAQKYAAKNSRIRVINNERFRRIIENLNHTVRQISPESKYCKFVFADDWLYPNCVEEMVHLAKENPTVGLVGAFTMDGQSVLNRPPAARGAVWQPSPHPGYVVPGAEVCRSMLLGHGVYVFATMTSLLLRSDLVRKRSVFFNEPHLHADNEACFDLLGESDFGFCQQVLSCTRPRQRSTSSFANEFDVFILGKLAMVLKYGQKYLDEAERHRLREELLREYYRVLAHSALRLRSRWYWTYHRDTLAAFGYRLDRLRFTMAMVSEMTTHLLHPVKSFRRSRHWWSQAVKRITGRRIERQPTP